MMPTRLLCVSLGLLAATAAGCGDSLTPETTPVSSTPENVIKPEAPSETTPAPVDAPKPAENAPEASASAVKPIDLAAASPNELFADGASAPKGAAATPATASAATVEIALQKQSFAQFRDKTVVNPNVKYTVVDVWATTCGPCKENFPHLVAMAKAYKDKGLACVSLSLDDRDDTQALAAALEFLKSKGATFTNVLLDEEFGAGYEQLGVNAIPAVFIYGPDGKEVKKYTLDDPDNQFAYEQVERDIKALLEGKALPVDQPKPVEASK